MEWFWAPHLFGVNGPSHAGLHLVVLGPFRFLTRCRQRVHVYVTARVVRMRV